MSFGLKKPSVLDRPGEGGCNRYEYGHAPIGYREYEEGRSFAHERRSGPPHRSVSSLIALLQSVHLCQNGSAYLLT